VVDVLTRQGVQVARARAEANGLARLLARDLASDTEALAEATVALRRIFDLDAVALLRRTDRGWEIDDAVGAPVPQRPEQAQFSVELTDQRLLAITSSRLTEEDTDLLNLLLGEMRQLQGQAQVDRLSSD
jgi:hypothetical protein